MARDNLEMYRYLFQESSRPMFLVDPDSEKIVRANASACELFGLDEPGLTSMRLGDLDMRSSKAMNTGPSKPLPMERTSVLSKHRRSNGNVLDVQIDLSPIRSQGKGVLLATLTDITRMNMMEERLEQSEGRLKVLTATALEGIIIYEKGRIREVNERASEVLGYPSGGLVGIRLQDLLGDKDWSALNRNISRASNEICSCDIRRKDGSHAVVEIRGMETVHEGSPARVLVLNDVDDRNRAHKVIDMFRELSERSCSTLPISEILSRVHSALLDLLPVKNLFIALVDHGGGTMTFPYFVDEKNGNPGTIALGKGLTERVCSTGKTVHLSEEEIQELIERGKIEPRGRMCIDWLGVPIRYDDACIGAVVVQSYSDNVRLDWISMFSSSSLLPG